MAAFEPGEEHHSGQKDAKCDLSGRVRGRIASCGHQHLDGERRGETRHFEGARARCTSQSGGLTPGFVYAERNYTFWRGSEDIGFLPRFKHTTACCVSEVTSDTTTYEEKTEPVIRE